MTDHATPPPIEGLPAPLTPPDCNLRGLEFMPLAVMRLLDSDFFALASGDEFKAGLALWCKSWTQGIAGSLPNNDKILAVLSGAGPAWPEVKAMALHGWVLCSDGRLYHSVVAEKAMEALPFRLDHIEKKSADATRKARERIDRKELFSLLRSVGKIPPYDTSTRALREMVAALPPQDPDPAQKQEEVTANPVTGVTNERDAGHGHDMTNVTGVMAKTGTGTGTGTVISKRDTSVSLVDTVDEAGWFAALWSAYPHVRGRSSKPKSRIAFSAVAPADQPLLAEAARRYAAGGTLPSKGPPSLARWLEEELYRDWLVPEAGLDAGTDAAPWSGPARVRVSIVAHMVGRKGGRDQANAWVRRWVDLGSTWSDVPPSIVCRSETVEIKLREGLADWLKANGTALVRLPAEVAA